MKPASIPCLVVTFLALSAASGFAQGLVLFANRDLRMSLDAPVLMPDGRQPAPFDTFVELLAGPSPGQLTRVGIPVQTIAHGYIVPSTVTVPGVLPGGTAFVQVRSWIDLGSPSYESAEAHNWLHGSSSVFEIVTGGNTKGGTQPPTLPGSLIGLKPLVLVGIVPEPSVTVLGLLGAALLLRGGRR